MRIGNYDLIGKDNIEDFLERMKPNVTKKDLGILNINLYHFNKLVTDINSSESLDDYVVKKGLDKMRKFKITKRYSNIARSSDAYKYLTDIIRDCLKEPGDKMCRVYIRNDKVCVMTRNQSVYSINMMVFIGDDTNGNN